MPVREPNADFGAWLLAQADRRDEVGELAKNASRADSESAFGLRNYLDFLEDVRDDRPDYQRAMREFHARA